MIAPPSLEERLEALEAAVIELQSQVKPDQVKKAPTNWLQQITGAFKDDPEFEKVLAYGQAVRQELDSYCSF